ncbi:uncharacterized protein [Clytia hemisphaerica]|uniref:uncharacterized protein n=1 Tax=Clytia hemisphaerica TaxID=252671 RepID=UPI0034D4DA50
MIIILYNVLFQVTLEAQRLFPGHLFKIFVDCIDEQNVRYRESKNCVLFKYVGENRYPIIESTLGVIPTTQPPPTNPATTTAATTPSPSTKPTTTTPKPEPSHKVERNENGDSIPGAAACDGTYVTRNDSTRSHECLKQMNDPITGCDYFINGSRAFGTIDQSDIDLQTQWKIAPQRSLFPFCLSGRRAVVGYVELQDYPNSLNAPIWNEKYGRVIKETLNFTTGNMSMTLEAQKLFPGHLIKIFVDCIDEQNVRYRDEKSCVLFKYVGENTYPIIASSLGVIPTTTVSPTPTPKPTPKADALKSEDDTDWLLIGILIGILLLIILILLIVCLICKRRKDKKRQEKVSKAETKAIEQNVSYRDNPTFMVLDVNDKPHNNGGHAPPESPTGKIPTKGTGTIDSPDGSKITSSAYLFMAGKEPEIKAVPPSNNDNSSKKHYDPVKLNIDMKHKSETDDNASYNVI